MTDRVHEEREGEGAGEAAPPAPARQSTGRERRRPGGRQRPYQALRVLAKLYAILAPLVLIGLVVVGLAGLLRSVPLVEKIGSAIGLLLLAGLYYLLMKAISDAIYILFDIAANIRRIREAIDGRSEPD